jgi:acetylornithine deacetylase/succinyl-diaminopimelate desuccinylase-like protein
VSPAVRDYLRAVAPLHDDRWRAVFSRIDEIVAPEGPRRPLLPGMANLFLDSVQVTVLRAGDAGETINSIPAAATARIDARLLDDTDATEFLERVRAALGREVRLTVLLESPPAAPAPASGPVFDTLRQVLGKEAPVVPAFISGFTDSRFFRERGIPAYGFSPFALEPDELRGVHGPDERIPLTEFDRGVERMKRVLTEIVER